MIKNVNVSTKRALKVPLYSIYFYRLETETIINKLIAALIDYSQALDYHCLTNIAYICIVSGDFAILIKSGMPIKHALAYNIVSALISYIGLILGIIIGNIESAHTWILALTAGMFLYISLVSMVSVESFLHTE